MRGAAEELDLGGGGGQTRPVGHQILVGGVPGEDRVRPLEGTVADHEGLAEEHLLGGRAGLTSNVWP